MKKVLIVVDMQNGFMNHKNYRELSEKIDRYISKRDYDLYIFTRFKDKENSLRKKYLCTKNMVNTYECDLSIKVSEKSVIFDKNGYGLSYNDLEYIKSIGVNTIDVCGL